MKNTPLQAMIVLFHKGTGLYMGVKNEPTVKGEKKHTHIHMGLKTTDSILYQKYALVNQNAGIVSVLSYILAATQTLTHIQEEIDTQVLIPISLTMHSAFL